MEHIPAHNNAQHFPREYGSPNPTGTLYNMTLNQQVMSTLSKP
jgi:hypothetical protein